MLNDVPSSIITKIQAALHLANNAGTEGEAAAAAAAVTRLLQQYNLDLAEVLAQGTEAEKSDVLGDIIQAMSGLTHEDSSRKSAWIHHLLYTVADANFCKPLVTNRRVIFVGRSENAKAAVLLFDYLYRVLTRIAKDQMKLYSQNFKKRYGISPAKAGGIYHPAKARKSWLLGAAHGVRAKIKERTADLETTALVAISTAEIEKVISDMGVTKGRARKSEYNAEAYHAGYQIGHDLNVAISD